MSVKKQSLIIQGLEPVKNHNLSHAHHTISRVYNELIRKVPQCTNKIDKYDLVANNLNEALLLIAYREKENERINNYITKLHKMVKKF